MRPLFTPAGKSCLSGARASSAAALLVEVGAERTVGGRGTRGRPPLAPALEACCRKHRGSRCRLGGARSRSAERCAPTAAPCLSGARASSAAALLVEVGADRTVGNRGTRGDRCLRQPWKHAAASTVDVAAGWGAQGQGQRNAAHPQRRLSAPLRWV